jgi:hypothetical protein
MHIIQGIDHLEYYTSKNQYQTDDVTCMSETLDQIERILGNGTEMNERKI